jgi:hypothetical protein
VSDNTYGRATGLALLYVLPSEMKVGQPWELLFTDEGTSNFLANEGFLKAGLPTQRTGAGFTIDAVRNLLKNRN